VKQSVFAGVQSRGFFVDVDEVEEEKHKAKQKMATGEFYKHLAITLFNDWFVHAE
jgi:hypothetical protein